MGPSTPLSSMRFAGKLCKRGAWVTAALGLALIVIFVINNIPNNQGNLGSGPNLDELLNLLLPVLLIALPTLFFFLILYAVAAVLDYLSAEKATPVVDDDDRVEITSLSEMR